MYTASHLPRALLAEDRPAAARSDARGNKVSSCSPITARAAWSTHALAGTSETVIWAVAVVLGLWLYPSTSEALVVVGVLVQPAYNINMHG